MESASFQKHQFVNFFVRGHFQSSDPGIVGRSPLSPEVLDQEGYKKDPRPSRGGLPRWNGLEVQGFKSEIIGKSGPLLVFCEGDMNSEEPASFRASMFWFLTSSWKEVALAENRNLFGPCLRDKSITSLAMFR